MKANVSISVNCSFIFVKVNSSRKYSLLFCIFPKIYETNPILLKFSKVSFAKSTWFEQINVSTNYCTSSLIESPPEPSNINSNSLNLILNYLASF
jgi:hypothetical protein